MSTGDGMLNGVAASGPLWWRPITISHHHHSSPFFITLLVLLLAVTTLLAPGTAIAQEKSYGGEDRDWNVAPTSAFRTSAYHAPTPRAIPGGRVLRTAELEAMRAANSRPYLIDVLGGETHRTIAGAFWLVGAGAGDLSAEEDRRFREALAKFAAGDRGRPMVFFCADSQCWLSYNAALRAIAAGYTNIMWYRGGIASWLHAGLPVTKSEPFVW